MPNVQISTYSGFEILANGEIVRVGVNKIISEEPVVPNTTKEVSVFEKYASKKSVKAPSKVKDGGLEK